MRWIAAIFLAWLVGCGGDRFTNEEREMIRDVTEARKLLQQEADSQVIIAEAQQEVTRLHVEADKRGHAAPTFQPIVMAATVYSRAIRERGIEGARETLSACKGKTADEIADGCAEAKALMPRRKP